MNKYQTLDDAICAHLLFGNGGHPTNNATLERIARELVEAGIGGRSPLPAAWRLIDRRIQAMRRAGRLEYVRQKGGGHGKWRVIPSEASK